LECEGWIVQQGHCFELDRLLPYAPLPDVLRALLTTLTPAEVDRSLGPVLPELAWLLPELALQPPRPSHHRKQDKHRIIHALVGALSRLAARKPLLLLTEDLHWADETSLELVAVLTRRVPREPILLLGTHRDDAASGGLNALLTSSIGADCLSTCGFPASLATRSRRCWEPSSGQTGRCARSS
jgi:hypothetical protein